MHIHLWVSLILFFIGVIGVLISRKNLILVFMSLELMILASNMVLVFFSIYLDDLMGQIFIFYILAIAAAETAVGLSILVAYYRTNHFLL